MACFLGFSNWDEGILCRNIELVRTSHDLGHAVHGLSRYRPVRRKLGPESAVCFSVCRSQLLHFVTFHQDLNSCGKKQELKTLNFSLFFNFPPFFWIILYIFFSCKCSMESKSKIVYQLKRTEFKRRFQEFQTWEIGTMQAVEAGDGSLEELACVGLSVCKGQCEEKCN